MKKNKIVQKKKSASILWYLLLATLGLQAAGCGHCQFGSKSHREACKADEDSGSFILIILALSRPTFYFPPNSSVFSAWHVVGTVIPSATPVLSDNSMTVTLSVSPALPSGITFDHSSGVFAGTPTAATAKTTYTFAATIATGARAASQITFGVDSTPANVTCNSSGIPAFCTASSPYTCPRSNTCFSSYALCQRSSDCSNYL